MKHASANRYGDGLRAIGGAELVVVMIGAGIVTGVTNTRTRDRSE